MKALAQLASSPCFPPPNPSLAIRAPAGLHISLPPLAPPARTPLPPPKFCSFIPPGPFHSFHRPFLPLSSMLNHSSIICHPLVFLLGPLPLIRTLIIFCPGCLFASLLPGNLLKGRGSILLLFLARSSSVPGTERPLSCLNYTGKPVGSFACSRAPRTGIQSPLNMYVSVSGVARARAELGPCPGTFTGVPLCSQSAVHSPRGGTLGKKKSATYLLCFEAALT